MRIAGTRSLTAASDGTRYTGRMSLILGIESSCDETAAAVVQDGRRVRSQVVASQVELHAPYGGVYPELAARAQLETIAPVCRAALAEGGCLLADLDAIAVTQGPGLVGSLLVGIQFAKGLALGSGRPLRGIHHLEGHIYSLWLEAEPARAEPPPFPLLALIVSGGHSELALVRGHGHYETIGRTRDDAAGEAFDKVARLLGLPYPGGPPLERAARAGDASAYPFPRAWLGDSLDFSFSGLKTAVRRAVTEPVVGQRQPRLREGVVVADVAASFQAALLEVLVVKTAQAAERYGAAAIGLVGGVSANQTLREQLRAAVALPVYAPAPKWSTDNGAMIAAAAHFQQERGIPPADWALDARPMWPLAAES